VLFVAVVLLLTGCTLNNSGSVRIHDQPISFSDWRQAATREYVAEHYGRQIDDITIEPRIIVLHWTAIADFDETVEAFDSESLPAARSDLGGTEQVNVSSQFLVDRNGAVYRLMPETWLARHTIGLNYSAIGVENVGGAGGVDNMTRRQIRANSRLVRYLKGKYPSIDYLIGHSEYREFEGHPLWLEIDDSYRTKKIDPGDRMMSKVRRAVADLGLKGIEEIRAERGSAR
jgi:N-acetyl-anhydromuramyl-L-alanine amidase AmpD